VTQRVCKMVACTEDVNCTRMVAKCVQKQVPYTVCKMVPVQVCPTSNCDTCNGASGVQQESAKPTPTPDNPPKPNAEA